MPLAAEVEAERRSGRTTFRGLGHKQSIGIRDTSRALSRDERDHLLKVAATYDPTAHLDVADTVWWLAGTAVRISEALNQRWADLELEGGTVLVRGTKTSASTRRLSLPGWLLEAIEQRAADSGTIGYVFPSPGLSYPTRPQAGRIKDLPGGVAHRSGRQPTGAR